METTKSNVKAIRVGDKIMIFINGKKQTISKSVSPEIFDVVLELIKNNEQEKISQVFSTFDVNLTKYLDNSFDIKNNCLFLKGSETELIYSKLILRKALEMMALNIDPAPLKKLSEKLSRKQKFEKNGNNVFQNVKSLVITKQGNLIFQTIFDGLIEGITLYGNPINIESRANQISYKINVNSINYKLYDEDELENLNKKTTNILVNPFDILSFGYNEINVSRFKVLDFEIKEKSIIEINNEEVFDIPYEIFLLKNS